jgi:hypothetical protein
MEKAPKNKQESWGSEKITTDVDLGRGDIFGSASGRVELRPARAKCYSGVRLRAIP